MISIIPSEIPVPKLHQYLLGSVGPRPICFASTVDKEGRRNLAPFSFFNVFSANPPIAVFSPARSGRTGTHKHTYENIKEVPEVVINVVNYDMVHQTSLARSPSEKGVDEFIKSGFTAIASDLIKPFRVKESPVQMECTVEQVIELGNEGGAGNLIICKIVKLHINELYLNEHGAIDQTKIDLVARMGGDWYCRAHGSALFEVTKPLTTCGIGIDALPDHIRLSDYLTGNELGMLGNVEQVPDTESLQATKSKYASDNAIQKAKELLRERKNIEALALLW
ncbi:MAG: flavin reductase family protein [Bacteroidota bacterium]